MSFHAAVWMDHEQAKVFHVGSEAFDEQTLRAPKSHIASSHKGKDSHVRGETHDDKVFYDAIVKAVSDAQEILVMGPGTAKLAFMKHVHKHDPQVEPKIIGVETSDHPTDGQIVAHVRKYFRAADRMLGTGPSL
jgi:stalled ribosome rescue protein Dom34